MCARDIYSYRKNNLYTVCTLPFLPSHTLYMKEEEWSVSNSKPRRFIRFGDISQPSMGSLVAAFMLVPMLVALYVLHRSDATGWLLSTQGLTTQHRQADGSFCHWEQLLNADAYSFVTDNTTKHPRLKIEGCDIDDINSEQAWSCLKGKTVVFVGDSIMRYQYLSLVDFLEYGIYPSDRDCVTRSVYEARLSFESANQTSEYYCDALSNEQWWDGWPNFYKYTDNRLNGNGCCDCYRLHGEYKSINFMENRVYTKNGAKFVYMQFFHYADYTMPGFGAIHGHWHCLDPSKATPPFCEAGSCSHPVDFNMPLDKAFMQVIKPLQPDFLIFNQGIQGTTNDWPDWLWRRVAKSALEAVKEKNGAAIWRTTSAVKKDMNISVDHDRKAVEMARKYGMEVFNLWAVTESFVKNNMENAYWAWNGIHFNDWPNAAFNNFLLNSLCRR